MTLATLALAAALWCAVHSLLATSAAHALCRRAPLVYRRYRLLYTVFASISLLPLIFFARALAGPTIFHWQGVLRLPQFVLASLAVFFFLAGARQYDMGHFLGLTANEAASNPAPLKTGGILQITRHPWYLAGLLLLWVRDLDAAGLILAAVFSSYLVIGTLLEEEKLLAVYGDSYRRYQNDVSMLLPLAWLGKRLGWRRKK